MSTYAEPSKLSNPRGGIHISIRPIVPYLNLALLYRSHLGPARAAYGCPCPGRVVDMPCPTYYATLYTR